jgi:hypothetical protein
MGSVPVTDRARYVDDETGMMRADRDGASRFTDWYRANRDWHEPLVVA